MSIVVDRLTKRYGAKVAVADLSFEVHPGVVTGFLGPNGSGKSTTMRCMLGLDRPDAGAATFGGHPYQSIARPLDEVGALLDAGYVHPARSGRNHLRWLAASNRLPATRVDEVLERVGLTAAARKPVRTYSLGMKQRLGLAGVLLGDPHTVILDEPGNGLDPEGIRWIRDALRALAGEGRTVFVSSHLLSEMSLMATSLVVIGQGRLVEQCSVEDFVARYGRRTVKVASPAIGALVDVLRPLGASFEPVDPSTVTVVGLDAARIGEVAAAHGIVLHQLADQSDTLEDSFLRATADVQEYRTGDA